MFEDFSDGNLNGWKGDTIDFLINDAKQLQLNAPSGKNQSAIYTNVQFKDSMSWDIYIRLEFAPSTSNQLRIYLCTDNHEFANASGYFLEIGASGNNDAIDLKHQIEGVATTIASSETGLVAFEPVDLRLLIIKNSSGEWKCFDNSLPIPELLFSAHNNASPLASLNTFGLQCKYTDTRRDLFYFDDISLQPIQPDTTAPYWLETTVIDDHTIRLLFDEALDSASANFPSNYILTPGNLSPNEVTANANEVILQWDNAFSGQQNYNLTIMVQDVTGNALTESREFTYLAIGQAEMYDMLITEIMADPAPSIGLPDAEYVEIYNHSNKIFDLSGYKMKIGSAERSFPDSLLLPGDYLIVTDEDHATEFSGYGKVMSVENMPGLTNSGTLIALRSANGETIHEISYTDEWYRDGTKNDGGWSIEMINPFHICAADQNWSATAHLAGGTPGSQNSRWNILPDSSGPELISVFTGSPNVIELKFNENIDPVLMLDSTIYPFQPALDISDLQIISSNTLTVNLNAPLEEGIIYTLFPFDAFDCLGNPGITKDTFIFGLVSEAGAGDILINEILFNPATGGSRFIEIINVSKKFIDMSSLSIGRLKPGQTDIYPIELNEILAPGSITAVTPDRSDILLRYNVPYPERLFESDLPAWDDKVDHAAIIAGGIIIDSLTYSSSWHHPVISDENGVSLERLSILSPASSLNWHSAVSSRGFATPTGPNSHIAGPVIVNPPFTVTNRHFSPDNDGFNDFFLLQFEPVSLNSVGSIWVYDLEGREVHQVLSNETIGFSTFIQWDGRNAEGDLADMGIYIVYIQVWDPDGNISEFQETCALVKR